MFSIIALLCGGDLSGKTKQRLYLSTQRERKGQKILHVTLLRFLGERNGQRNLRKGASFISAKELIT